MTTQSVEARKLAIQSATDMLSVVRTMKAMAAVNIRQFEAATDSLQSYTTTVASAISMLMTKVTPPEVAFADQSRTGAIVFGSDQGMCGSFNETIVSFALDSLNRNRQPTTAHAKQNVREQAEFPPPIVVGYRAADTLLTHEKQPFHVSRLPATSAAITSASHDLVPIIDRWKRQHNIQRVILFHNRRVSASLFRPHAVQLIPLRFDRIRKSVQNQTTTSAVTGRSLPWWSLPTDELFSFTVRQNIFSNLFLAFAESLSAENAGRIAAMQSAENNIRDRIEELQQAYSQERQANITAELLDITSGFAAQQISNPLSRMRDVS